jgi:NTP pyrophosphatase (non-canonical NTP hydrolase)
MEVIDMVDLTKLQKEIYQNKVDKGFNVTDVNKEFCLTYGEVAEAYEAWKKKKEDLGEELADVAIYLLGLSEILGIDLEDEIQKKVYKNSKREYKIIDGVNTRVKEFEDDSER